MSPKLCASCGARAPDPDRPCPACGEEPSRWVLKPVTFGDALGRLAVGVVMFVSGVACLGAAVALCSGWAWDTTAMRVVQVLLAAVVVLFGVPVGFALLWGSVQETFARDYTLGDGRRSGSVRMALGFVLHASGDSRGSGVASDLMLTAIDPVALFAAMPRLRAGVLPLLHGPSGTAGAVDLALFAALTGLVERGQLALGRRCHTHWSLPEGATDKPVTSRRYTLQVRRPPGAPPAELETGFLERAFLAAFRQASSEETTPLGAGPYRTGLVAGPSDEAAGEWRDVPALGRDVLSELGGDKKVLRSRLREQSRGRTLGDDEVAALGALLSDTLRFEMGDHAVGAALLSELREGFRRYASRPRNQPPAGTNSPPVLS